MDVRYISFPTRRCHEYPHRLDDDDIGVMEYAKNTLTLGTHPACDVFPMGGPCFLHFVLSSPLLPSLDTAHRTVFLLQCARLGPNGAFRQIKKYDE